MSSDADPRGSPTTLHQSKFSMGTVLGLIAVFGRAGMQEFEGALDDPRIAAFRDKVKMAFDAEVDAAYPTRWIGKVTVRTIDGRTLYGRADPPLGDPASTLSRAEIGQKVVGLAEFSGAATAAEMRRVCDWAWKLTSVDPIGNVLTSA